jgi:uncharacterized protein YjbI with pentapeptide repeats
MPDDRICPKYFDSGGIIVAEKKVKILLDLPVEDGVLGFDNYRDALINIIKGSDPRFTIGIFGGWGTGKTTLMKMMKKRLDDEKTVTVWFNPWEYEKERHLMVPLLQTLKLELETKYKDQVKQGILDKLGDIAVSFAKSLKPEINLGITKFSFDPEKFIEKEDEKKDFASLYFELNKQLKEITQNIKKDRIVIFVDDLDRCLPDKALQVLESVKLFLDAEGYVFVIGLDRNIIEKCVDKKYGKESGISGTDYIKKIIQVPFNLPGLREQEVKTYVQCLKDQLKGTEVEKYVEKYIDLISRGMEANPREIKRFINNFILVNQISAGETEPDKLLALLIIQFRWEEFYKALAGYKTDFLASVYAYMEESRDLKSEEGRQKFMKDWGYLDLIEHSLNSELRSFLKTEVKILSGLTDLDPYIHFSKAVTIPESEKPKIPAKEELISLLKEGRISEFNKIRPDSTVDLSGANLSRAGLSKANLIRAYLIGADLSVADLEGADLRRAVMFNANLSGTNLRRAELEGADLRKAEMIRADLRRTHLDGAELIGAYLHGTNLSGADLSGADLSGADLSETNLNGIIIDEYTIFQLTIIQDAKNLSPEIRNTLNIKIENGVEKATSKQEILLKT